MVCSYAITLEASRVHLSSKQTVVLHDFKYCITLFGGEYVYHGDAVLHGENFNNAA